MWYIHVYEYNRNIHIKLLIYAIFIEFVPPKQLRLLFAGFQAKVHHNFLWFPERGSSAPSLILGKMIKCLRCIPVVRGCWFRWWCYSSHFEQAHCRYHIQCNYSRCSSLSWGGPVSCRCWSVEWSPGHLLTQSSPCWCRTRSRRREDCDRFRSYVPEVHFLWKCQDREVLAQRNGHESCSHECNGEVTYFSVTLSMLSTIPDHPHLM